MASSDDAASHRAFLKRTMVKSAPTKVDVGVVSKPVNRETGSCFQTTVVSALERRRAAAARRAACTRRNDDDDDDDITSDRSLP